MGYEELEVGGRDAQRAARPRTAAGVHPTGLPPVEVVPVEVVPIEAGPIEAVPVGPPAGQVPGTATRVTTHGAEPPTDADATSTARTGRTRTVLVRLRLLPGRHGRGVAVAGVVLALVVGLVVGTQVGSRRQRSADAARASAQALVAAQITTENSYAAGGDRVVGLTVRLVNYGTATVDVVESQFEDAPRPGRPRVRTAGAQTDHVQPRGSTLVAVTAVLDCGNEPQWPTVPVRTADGSLHQVELATAGLGALAAVTVCAQPTSSTYSPVPLDNGGGVGIFD